MLMIVTVIPATAFSITTVEIKEPNTKLVSSDVTTQTEPTSPTPGHMTTPHPHPDLSTIKRNVVTPPDITVSSMNDIIIDMLEQVDPSIFLGYLENITSFGPRVTGTSACVAAAQYIYNQFQSMELAVRYHPWNNGGYSSNNVEATINGTDPSSDDIYIICAHYDTVSAGPGADDDGSGTSAVLTAAYVMSQYQFNYTVKFVTFSGEEQGLLGSEVYAAQAAAQGWDIVGVLNADMISYAVTQADGNNLIVFENTASEWLYTFTSSVNTQYYDYIHLTLHHGGYTWGSDHNSFWDQGYDALFYFEYTETPYYHTSGDTLAHVNITYGTKNTRLIIATLAELAHPGYPSNPPAAPTITGPTFGLVNKEYTYTVVATDPDGDDVYYYIDWGDNSNSGWIGPYNSGTQVPASHTWNSPGTYVIRAKAKDVHHVSSEWSNPLTVTIVINRPPNKPTITGPSNVKPLIQYLFTFNTTDPDGDDIQYNVVWGDGNSQWYGPYNSGQSVSANHRWIRLGTYYMKVRAKDQFENYGDWTFYTIKVTFSFSFITIQNNQFNQIIKQKIL